MKKILLLIIIMIYSEFGFSQNPNVTLTDAFPNLSFNKALFLTHSGDGTNRIFVVQQDGKIIVFPNDSNATLSQAKTFLNISNKISSSSGEEGLLGLAFHPNYISNGYFYINYTAGSPLRTVISRFKISIGDPNKADSLSEYKILEINQPYSNHNGGSLMFGFDGFLYIGMGDGGSSGDPSNNAQNLQVLLGKMLRININDTTASRRYVIPNTNPFYNNPTAGKEEIFTYGMRNPWKFSQDPLTGLIYCGDVGQNIWEEIDIIQNGKNYGWRVMEGFACYNPSSGCDTTGKTLPIKVYDHTSGNCSVTGGYVYRGYRRPELRGAYIYGDYCSGKIWMLRYNNGVVTSDSLLLQKSIAISSFGVDQYNELYVIATSATGKIWRFNKSPDALNAGNNETLISGFDLKQNFPNPFNPSTTIKYTLPERSFVKLEIYDISGRFIKSLVNTYQSSGDYAINWNGKDQSEKNVSSGIYFYVLSNESKILGMKRMAMIK